MCQQSYSHYAFPPKEKMENSVVPMNYLGNLTGNEDNSLEDVDHRISTTRHFCQNYENCLDCPLV